MIQQLDIRRRATISPALSIGSHVPGESVFRLIRAATFPEISGAPRALSTTTTTAEVLEFTIPEDAVDGDGPVLVDDTS